MSEQQVTNEPQSICANCQQPGTQLCKCKQVFYCGDECKVKHRQHHRVICDSDMLSDKWRPIWEIEECPSRLNDTGKREDVATKYLWGDVPAIDVLKLKENEGDSYNEPLSIMFAASGDIRHIVKTIAELPTGYEGDLTLYINDQETDVVARNVLLLIIMFGIDGKDDEVIDTILHVWYPAFITPKHRQFLTADVQTFLNSIVANSVPWQYDNGTCAERFTTSRLFNLNFGKRVWDRLMSFFDATKFPPHGEATRLRRDLFYARRAGVQRVNCEDVKTLLIYSHQRPGWLQFREDGILLPLGHSREEYKVPNPTLFTSKDWLLKCQSDPNDGWNIADVLRPGNAKSEDSFGKLHRYIKDVLKRCRDRLSSLNCRIHMTSCDAKELAKWAAGRGLTFDRIECSNIADSIYVGMDETIQHLSPLLKHPGTNKLATLLTLSMKLTNEVDEYLAKTDQDTRGALVYRAHNAVQPLLATRPGLIDEDNLLGQRATWSMWDPRRTLGLYKECRRFDYIEQKYGVNVKEVNTITQRFVLNVDGQIDDDIKLQFWNFFSSFLHCPKCYLEWNKRHSSKRAREDDELDDDEEDQEKKRRKFEDHP